MAGRETFGSRLGFLLLSAGCAIGLGNVWRFPFVTGKYGGAVFLFFYLLFLVLMGLPVLIMEFAVGRASALNMGSAFRKLEPKGAQWHRFGWMTIVGCYLLMMFYIPVAGWMVDYMFKGFTGELLAPGFSGGGGTPPLPVGIVDGGTLASFAGRGGVPSPPAAAEVAKHVQGLFDGMLSNPLEMTAWTVAVSAAAFGVCAFGVRKGVERVTKFMMAGLLLVLVGLAVYALTFDGAGKGLAFYLKPDFHRAMESGIWALINDAMNQAFFTLSIGIGSMCIFGSYLKRERTLTSESVIVTALDTFVALVAGLIIFPACFAFGVKPDAGPGLVFVTLPNVFNGMPRLAGRVFGSLFFVFMSVAALTTVIAVVENCIAYFMDVFGWSRRRSTLFNFLLLTALTIPCVLGFNVWSGFKVPHIGGVLDCEDFLVSTLLLPFGSLIFCLFCTCRYGWGWRAFVDEADAGRGMRFPRWARFYLTWILPLAIAALFLTGLLVR